MEDYINVGDYITIEPDCCGFGVRGKCSICWFDWANCICGQIDELCSCGTKPNMPKFYEEINRRNKLSED